MKPTCFVFVLLASFFSFSFPFLFFWEITPVAPWFTQHTVIYGQHADADSSLGAWAVLVLLVQFLNKETLLCARQRASVLSEHMLSDVSCRHVSSHLQHITPSKVSAISFCSGTQ